MESSMAERRMFPRIGVYSSGIISGGRGAPPATTPAPRFGEAWEKQNLAALHNAANKRGGIFSGSVPGRTISC
jgi:hypothetical protein